MSRKFDKDLFPVSPRVLDPDSEDSKDALSLAYHTTALKRRLNSSLLWYINQSLQDMLEDYFVIGDEGKDITERQEILRQIVDLPIGADETTRQLFVTMVLETIQREIVISKGRCMELMTGLFRRLDPKKSEVSNLLLKDFELLIDHVFFKDAEACRETDNDDSRRGRKGKGKPTSRTIVRPVSERLKESIAYAKVLIKIYRLWNKRFPILVVLNKLSLQKPNPYFANLLLYILKEVGASILEDTKCKTHKTTNGGNGIWNLFSVGLRDTPTIDNVLGRVENFYKYVPSQSECVVVVKRLVDERRSKNLYSMDDAAASVTNFKRFDHVTLRRPRFNLTSDEDSDATSDNNNCSKASSKAVSTDAESSIVSTSF